MKTVDKETKLAIQKRNFIRQFIELDYPIKSLSNLNQ